MKIGYLADIITTLLFSSTNSNDKLSFSYDSLHDFECKVSTIINEISPFEITRDIIPLIKFSGQLHGKEGAFDMKAKSTFISEVRKHFGYLPMAK